MRVRLFLILAGFVTLVLAGCTSEEPLVDNLATMPNVKESQYRVSLQNALKNADVVMRHIDTQASTRAGRQIATVDYIVTPKTRSGGDNAIDTALYLVNYQNEQGFALLAADVRLHPIYAISDTGSLNLADTVSNPGLAIFVNQLNAGIAATSSTPFLPIDSVVFNPVWPDLIDPGFEDRKVTISSETKPWLGKYTQMWGQRANFNKYCPFMIYTQVPVGCVPLGCAMIMSHYKWPQTFNGLNLDWDYINNWDINSPSGNCPDVLASLLYQIGMTLDITYEPRNSTVHIDDFKAKFQNLGFNKIGKPKNFNDSGVYPPSDLAKGPLLMWAATVPSASQSETTAHTWVIDGHIIYREDWNALLEGFRYYAPLYHCVWGWNGNSNGYFYWYSNKDFGGSTPDKYADGEATLAEAPNYKFTDLQYWCDFTH